MLSRACPAQYPHLLTRPSPCTSVFGSGLQLTRRPFPQEDLESYELGAIVRCDVVMPPGQSRSLLLLVCQEPERAQPDVHFFQGLRLGVSGQTLGTAAEDRAGTPRTPGREGASKIGAWPGAKAGSGSAEGDVTRKDVLEGRGL